MMVIKTEFSTREMKILTRGRLFFTLISKSIQKEPIVDEEISQYFPTKRKKAHQ